jgi:hypothetical protein
MGRPKLPHRKERVHININPFLLNNLKEEAEAQKRSISAHIELMLENYIATIPPNNNASARHNS